MLSKRVIVGKRQAPPARRIRRKGALLTFELVLVLPIVIGFAFGILELSLLLAAQHRVELASAAACRIGTLPARELNVQRIAIERAAGNAMGVRLTHASQIDFYPGFHTGDPVRVRITVPMNRAAPDLLRWLGLGLGDRQLVADTTMRRE